MSPTPNARHIEDLYKQLCANADALQRILTAWGELPPHPEWERHLRGVLDELHERVQANTNALNALAARLQIERRLKARRSGEDRRHESSAETG